MEVGTIQVAADEDFEKLWQMVSDNSWKLEYQHENINVWSKHSSNSDVKIVKVSINLVCLIVIFGVFRELLSSIRVEQTSSQYYILFVVFRLKPYLRMLICGYYLIFSWMESTGLFGTHTWWSHILWASSIQTMMLVTMQVSSRHCV